MKTMKMALLAGAAVAVSTAAANADQLTDLKAQVEALNARVAAMETAPSVPAGYQLLAISKGEAAQIPGLDQSNRDRFSEGSNATIISVMPTADAPAGTTISWSGYVRAAVIYQGAQGDAKFKRNVAVDAPRYSYGSTSFKVSGTSDDDWDVAARGQLRVVATTDTAVGEVGVELKMRADMNGNGPGTVYMKTAWGYWAMTPELTLGGGYAGSLGNIGYGYDGACTCYYTDNAGVGFDPGDTTQMRLSYASGPFSMAVALEDAGLNKGGFGYDNDYKNGSQLGVAGEIKYSGDAFSGEISGVWRQVNNDDYTISGTDAPVVGGDWVYDGNVDDLWQVGVGVGFNLGDIASLSLAAALGSGPFTDVNSNGDVTAAYPIQQDWWGVSGLASANLSDAVHAEVGLGYKHREGDSHYGVDPVGPLDPVWKYSGATQERFAVLGGLYYTPVDQLTIGLEGEWYNVQNEGSRKGVVGSVYEGVKDKLSTDVDNWTVDLVSVWRF